MANWAELLPELLFMIAMCIEVPEDFISFGCACSTWQAATRLKGATKSLQAFPYLILTSGTICTFYSFRRNKIYRVPLTESSFLGSSIMTNWWSFKQDETILVNPFSCREIPLPALNNYVEKWVLSCSPSFSYDDYIVMIINCKSRLAFWKHGDQAWTEIETYNAPFKDIIYYRGQFYAVDYDGVIYVCNVRGYNPTIANSICKLPIDPTIHYNPFLVDCVGRINNPNSIFVGYDYRRSYQLFEVDLSRLGRWKDVTFSSEDRTIFLDDNKAVGIEGSKFPPGIIKADSIFLGCPVQEPACYIDCLHEQWMSLLVSHWSGCDNDFYYLPHAGLYVSRVHGYQGRAGRVMGGGLICHPYPQP